MCIAYNIYIGSVTLDRIKMMTEALVEKILRSYIATVLIVWYWVAINLELVSTS